jgi:hypothetical protein
MIDRKTFLTDRDETGREIHTFKETGKQYFVEYIEPKGGIRTDWGSYNPSTGNIENKKGAGKFTGGIREEDSLITKENGFNEIVEGAGASVYGDMIAMHNKWKKENGYG